MASVGRRDLPSGPVWQVRYRQDGKNRALTFGLEAKAKEWAKTVNAIGVEYALKLLEIPDAKPALTIDVYLGQYIDNLTGATEGTRSDYRTYLRRDIGPVLGAYPLSVLDYATVAAWVNGMLARGLSGKSIRNRHSLLSGALTRAVKDKHISEHPCKGMPMPRTDHTKIEMVCLTRGEVADVLTRIADHYRPLAMFLFGTGCRIGEATALTVGDVHEVAGRWSARITKAWKHTDGHGHQIGPPKSKKGTRTIRLTPEVVEQLDLSRPRTDLLFVTAKGDPVRQQRFYDAWAPAVAHLPRRPRVHDARHTYASVALAGGVSLAVLQRQLGHESITTTVDTYGHLAPSDFDGLADIVSASLPRLLGRGAVTQGETIPLDA